MGWLDKLLGREKKGAGETGGSAGMPRPPQEESGGGQPSMPPPEPREPESGEQDRM